MKKGWEKKQLSEVCDFGNGLWTGKKPPFIEVGVIRNTNFTKDCHLDCSDIVFLNVEQSQFAKRKLKYGDIILEKSGGGPKQAVGRVVIFDKHDGDFSFSNFTSLMRVKHSKELDFNYLHKYLFFSYLSGETEKMQSHSTGIRNLKFGEYKQMLVPLPPLPEQKRIVAVLDEAFSAISTAKANAEKNLQNDRELFESYLQSVFANPGDGWEEKKLGEVVKTTQGIQILKSAQKNRLEKNYRRYLYISDFDHDSNLKYVEDIYPSKIVTEKDLIVVNTGATAGKIYRGIDGILSNNLFKVSFQESILNSDFLYYFVTSDIFKSFQKKIVRGTANPHMGHKNFNSTPFYLPPLVEQKRIVAKLDAFSAETKKLEVIYQKKIADSDELKKSVLQKAFNGELAGACS